LDNNHLVADGLGVDSNSSCQAGKDGISIPYNTGLAIEGLAILFQLGANKFQNDFNQL